MTKITATDGEGYQQKIYLDCDDTSTCGCPDGRHPGAHKHTDDPCICWWSEPDQTWYLTWTEGDEPLVNPSAPRSRTQIKRLSRAQRKGKKR